MIVDSNVILFGLYRSALRAFKRRVAYANANFDRILHWVYLAFKVLTSHIYCIFIVCFWTMKILFMLNYLKDMVGWRTSSIRRQHELPKVKLSHSNLFQRWHFFLAQFLTLIFFFIHFHLQSNLLVIDEKYPHIVHVKQETFDDVHNNASSAAEDQNIDLEGLSNFFLADLCLIKLWPRCWGCCGHWVYPMFKSNLILKGHKCSICVDSMVSKLTLLSVCHFHEIANQLSYECTRQLWCFLVSVSHIHIWT